MRELGNPCRTDFFLFFSGEEVVLWIILCDPASLHLVQQDISVLLSPKFQLLKLAVSLWGSSFCVPKATFPFRKEEESSGGDKNNH